MKLYYSLLSATAAASALTAHPIGNHKGASNLTFAGVAFPDTPTVHATYSFITQYLDPPTLNHVLRSVVFALLTTSKLPRDTSATIDTEIITVAGLLHDMSWNVYTPKTQQFITPTRRFEVDGATIARDFLTHLAWDPRRTQLVWDAIALHTTLSIGQYKEPEVALTQVGIALDVFAQTDMSFAGIPDDARVTQAEFDGVYAALPAPGFTEYLKVIGTGLCIHKPATTWDNIVGTVGVEFVQGYSLGHVYSDALLARAEREGIANFTDKVPM